MFNTEKDLVENTIPMFESFFKFQEDLKIIQEPKGLFGIPDVLLYNGHVIAIEFKLNKWKRALEQAFRYRSFSRESYVFLDNDYTDSAVRNIEQFRKYNIGLCGVSKSKIIPYFVPENKNPYSESMLDKACEIISSYA